jgi:hypothetical protein
MEDVVAIAALAIWFLDVTEVSDLRRSALIM